MMSGMGNIGGGEIIFIAIFALLVFGPKRLPEIGRSVGKALGELRRATNELKEGFTAGFEDMNFDELKEPLFLTGPIKPRAIPDPNAPAPSDQAAGKASAEPVAASDPPEGDGATAL